jgi:hypothetical protein
VHRPIPLVRVDPVKKFVYRSEIVDAHSALCHYLESSVVFALILGEIQSVCAFPYLRPAVRAI